MRPMIFRRTFYPVGQGAFYVEEFKLYDGSMFTIVYDCGSTTLKIRGIEKEIERVFPKGHQIDILFISHFHADNINGINKLRKHCRIKEVIMPLINDKTEIIILQALNYIETGIKNYNDLIENPEKFFSENDNGEWRTTITRISPTNDEQEYGNNVLKSGKHLNHLKSFNWVFIPFNYKQNDWISFFKEKLEHEGISLEDINKIINNETSDREYRQKIKILKCVYTMLLDYGDLNKTSMILYSGPQEDRSCYNFLSLQPAFSLFPRRSCLFDTFYNKEKTNYYGCLYTGDVDLTGIDIIIDIESRLNKAGVLSYIGTLQIPHHGSKHNFDKSILYISNISYAIFSFGLGNTYGHPEYTVIKEVQNNNITPYLITEEIKTVVVQEGFLY